ncbi:ABC transporter ATP-binding protein [Corynebacterium lujinxingii]|uniref:ABC transporter ATP-binding protein n=1 Tax=Corynebacterium lujinxingii TaxID=2763010 RepID=A0A7H0JYQ3_9CORY|nr:ABC transporter ATP-binding protein [Corynebacterium lujinxingii]MBC3179725.1 ABC transporter ATP-binding protein [Corynebacterium lujinxingii]NNO11653.1 ATP-binding cassette domain-containing protein [Corynebacterium lujinxingii]QNP90169.1 ABC transporter ATP-binding protein [Corynebacterium lujinxingii]
MLELNDVTVSFKDGQEMRTVLDHLEFTAKPGEMTFIIGESGSGKSTLLSVAAGLIKPVSGTAKLNGVEVDNEVRRDKIGMIFQQANLIAALNVRDQLLVTDHIRGVKPRRDRAEELLATVGLEGLGDRRIGEMSGGQRQRVGIARALMGEPELLLADEPTASLDADRSQEIVALLRDLATERDIACGFVTHDRSLIESSDEVFEMGVSAPAYA